MTQPTDGHPADSDGRGTGSGPVEFTDVPSPSGRSEVEQPASRPRSRALLVGGVATVLLLGVGGALAVQQLSSGGPQPAEVLPGDTFGYVQVDIDPSAGQKLAAVRFLAKVPEIKQLESGDARQKLWELAVAQSDDACVKAFDYARDIAPWLGDRVGFGFRPGGTPEQPNVVIALQASDVDRALSTLDRLTACGAGGDDVDLRTKDGYVILARRGQGDATLAATDQGTLAQNASFTSDMEALGEQGVAATWWDLGAAIKEFAGNIPAAELPSLPPTVQGRMAAALRFDPGYAEIAGIARAVGGSQSLQPVDGAADALVGLPDDTIAALHVSGGAAQLEQAWPELEKQLNDAASASGMDDTIGALEDELGLSLPDDLKALFGTSFTVSVPDQDFGQTTPAIGATVVTDHAQRAEEVVTTIEEASGAAGFLTKQVDGNRLYLSTTRDYAARLKAGGRLGDSAAFTAALGEGAGADYAVYVDLDRLEALYLDEVEGEARAAVEAMRSVGMSSTVTGVGEAEFSLRVVAN
ncbi:DUF3352 domain-containing protein [Intrasporangium sp. DVR]|uniref:DUF3352 domain-containing protein n=1 Tax=Intrasporangium sp. DVR TaxID=3127867 RepID=UPI00313A6482